jgi:heptosyltransferase-2
MNIPVKKWTKKNPPKRILAIRLQAMGDLVITLPYLQALRNLLPESTHLDLLTREEVDPIPNNIYLFNRIYSIGGGRNFKKQFIHTWWLLPRILMRRYDVVLDLQNNLLSKIVRKGVAPDAWSEFDKVSPIAAGERTRLTIEAAGLGNISAFTKFKLKKRQGIEELLKKNGWDGASELVILNPAGAFSTRNWPIENYIGFARLYLKKFPSAQFLIIGVDLISQKANYLKEKLGESLINLVNKTTAAEAFAIVQKALFVLSEDSGLMHMGWVSGIPTLALFGSTRSDWSRPLGEHTLLLGSSDLPCGNCMRETCIYNEVRCLIRYTAEFVFAQAVALAEKVSHDS